MSVATYIVSNKPVDLNTIQMAKNESKDTDHGFLPVMISNSHSSHEETQEILSALRRDVDLLKKEIVMLKTDKQFLLHSAGLSDEHMAADEARPKLTREELIAQQEKIAQMEEDRVKKQNQEFETEFQQQATNNAWSIKTEQLIKDALIDSNFLQADIVDLQCRSSKCRVEVLTGDTEQEQSNLMIFPSKIVAELPNINLNQTNGRTTIIYLSKNDLPAPIKTIGPLSQLQ